MTGRRSPSTTTGVRTTGSSATSTSHIRTGGYYLMLVIDVVLFGPIGITVWAVQMLWQPVFAAGVINGIGHWWGYRNYETQDVSTNIVPWGILIGGVRSSTTTTTRSPAPRSCRASRGSSTSDGRTSARSSSSVSPGSRSFRPRWSWFPASSTRTSRRFVPSSPTGSRSWPTMRSGVLNRVYTEEDRKESIRASAGFWSPARFAADARGVDAEPGGEAASGTCPCPQRCDRDRLSIQTPAPGGVGSNANATHEHLVEALREWCRQAEESGVRALEEFARTLPAYSMRPGERRSLTSASGRKKKPPVRGGFACFWTSGRWCR